MIERRIRMSTLHTVNDDVFDDGADYGEILFARTLLEQIGEKFEYPSMKED
jgi:hypothetical protein